jgi:hypothetical protein
VLLGLYEVWHCRYEAVLILSVGLELFCELHSEFSTELHSTLQHSHMHHASENWRRILPESITFPFDGVTLNFSVEEKVNWDVPIALNYALIRVGSEAPTIDPQ